MHPLKVLASLRVWRFLWNLFVWECIVILGVAAIFIHSGGPRRVEREDLEFFGPTLLFGPVAVGVWSVMRERPGALESFFFGAACSIAVVTLGGIIWTSMTGGFERQIGVFVGSLLLSIPAAIAGGIVGWMNRRKP